MYADERRSCLLSYRLQGSEMTIVRDGTVSSMNEKTLSVDTQTSQIPVHDPYLVFPKVTSPGGESQTSRLHEAFLPPSHSNRTLVLCFDGTGLLNF